MWTAGETFGSWYTPLIYRGELFTTLIRPHGVDLPQWREHVHQLLATLNRGER